ncbi:MAG: beta-1,6-N-acetylglucosaminyltransferase [Pseudomonadota bacterium]
MSVGFVMLAHAALHRSAQVAKVISDAGLPLVIHVDARVGPAYDTFRSKVAGLPHVTLAPRTACEWGTWALVQASRDGAEVLLRNHPELTHVYLISGACLPIKPLSELASFLANNKDTDFIESVTIGEVPWTKGGLSDERFTLTFPFPWRRRRRLFDLWVDLQRRAKRKRRLPAGLDPHMGSQWWCLTRGTLERILSDDRRYELERYFKRVWIPDESYFQSLVRLYGTKVESRSLTLSKFDFQGKPHVFYDDHLALLRQSPLFFARKIWPGANRLYRSFLDGRPNSQPIARISSAHIDRTFIQASARRTRGRPGMVMVSRFPSKEHETMLTAAPYAVFHGFSDIFRDFSHWVRANTGSRAHDHLFDRNRVRYFGGQTGYAGALCDSAALRDYNPEQFLRNLIWNTRGEHQSFLFSPRDMQEVTVALAADRNASISVVTGAWALPLLRSRRPLAEVRRDAAILQRREADFIDLLNERQTRARARVWSLAEFLERPLDPLQEIADSLSGAEPHLLAEMPELKPMDGLVAFLQSLRNAGMNPHMAGDITDEIAASVTDDKVTRFG